MIAIWHCERTNIADAADMAAFAPMGEVWLEDLERLGPWQRRKVQGFNQPLNVATQPAPVPLLLLVAQCSSSLDVAWHLREIANLPLFSAVLASSQWAGRGQVGRRWISPPGNLYGTWLLPATSENSPAVSLIMGYAVVLVLRDLGLAAQVKWPNDVLLNGHKVAGILCEQRRETVVAGIGINVSSCPAPHDLRDDSACPATALAKHGVQISPLTLWLRFLQMGMDLLASSDKSTLMKQLERHLAYRNQQVWVRPWASAPFPARINGLDATGALWVECADGSRKRMFSASLASAEKTEEMESLL